MREKAISTIFLGLVLAGTWPAQADTETFVSVRDNTLYESATGDVSNGAGPSFIVGRTNQVSNYRRRGLVAFDLSTSIPVGSTVTSAALTLAMLSTSSGAHDVQLRRALADWGEGASNAGSLNTGAGTTAETGDATWIYTFFNSLTWATPGGDFSGAVTDTQSVNAPGVYVWSSAQLVSDVQFMVNTPASNFGWLLLGDEAVAQTTKVFGTRENSTPANRPALTVTFTPPARVGDWSIY